MNEWKLAWTYLLSSRRRLSLATTLSLLGLVLGVSCLVLSMAVVSGYSTTLQKSITDAMGHVMIMKRGGQAQHELINELMPYLDGFEAATPFVYIEAMVVQKGSIHGVALEGLDLETLPKVLNLKQKIVEGQFTLATGEEPDAVIGVGLAKKYNLKVGDEIKIVIPLTKSFDVSSFRPVVRRFKVSGIIDLGRHDFNIRYVAVDLSVAQQVAELGNRVTGYRVRLDDPNKAMKDSFRINNEKGDAYWARDWFEVNRNIFEAAEVEKVVLFFVLLLLVVVASVNVANALFANVIQRLREVSLLRALGASQKTIRRLFLYQGLWVGLLGSLIGIIVGFLSTYAFEWAQNQFQLIPGDVYKLEHIHLEVRFLDQIMIIAACLLICFISSWFPARRSVMMDPVEGLRYE